MARKTSVWLTGLVLVTALVTISLVGLKDVSAYKLDAAQSTKQATKATVVPAVKIASNQSITASGNPQFIGENKIAVGVQPYANAGVIEFSNGYKINTDVGEPNMPADLKYDTPKGDEPAYYIVQFNGPVQDAWRKGLEKAGAEVMFYLPNYAFVVRMNQTIDKNIRASKSEVKWTGLYQPAYKISPRLASNAKGGKIRASITLFSPEDISGAIKQIEAVVGHKIFYKSTFEWEPGKFNKKIFVDISLDKLSALANLKGVSWMEPMPVFKIHNAVSEVNVQNGTLTANARPFWAVGISGEGQLIQNLDTGCAEANEYFQHSSNRKSTWYWDATHRKVVGQQPGAREDEIDLGWAAGTMSKWGDESANSYHGTHTTGSNAGNDSSILTGIYEGMAKHAKLVFIDGGGDSGSVYGTWDINRVGSWGWDSTYKYISQRACISSNSWGSDDGGTYSSSSMESDQFMWSHKDYLWIFSNGNTGTEAVPLSKAGSPATAKNSVNVGAVATAGALGVGGANTKATFSSWGRLLDGRLSPTVCAPGVNIISADGDGAGTRTMSGTSMSAPIVAGATALLRQYFTDGWYPTGTKIAANGFTPSAALMKATLAISGDSTTSWCGSFVPDSLFGWGRVNLDTALYLSGNQVKLLVNDNRTGVNTGEAVEYLVNIPAGASGLKISLTWTDYPGSTTAAKALVNDLDLDAYNPAAARYRGNRYGSVLPRQSVTTATDNDNIDILEGIKVVAPPTGIWRIRVTGKNVAMGPQPFALVITYRTALPAMGKVYLDKNSYDTPIGGGVGDTLRIEIVDPNNILASNNVSVYAKLVETTPEIVSCVKVGDGLFRGKIALYNGNPVNGDGRLSVDYLDSVRVVYVDNIPAGAADTAYASINGGSFTITNVRAGDTQPPAGSMKLIMWNTSQNTTSRVYYGTTTALGSTTAVDTPLMTNNIVTLSGLAANQIYYYDVESKDANGNTLRDDNAGRHYMFSTGGGSGQNDILIWMWDDNGFANSFIHADYLTSALTQGGWGYDWWSSQLQGAVTTAQLKKYKAVFIQVAQDGSSGGTYPAFTPAQRDTLIAYHNAGARFAVTGNDIGWDTWLNQAAGPDLQADTIFCRNYLHFSYVGDHIVENSALTIYGVASDPISGAYTAGVSHTSWREGACGDSIRNSHYLPGYTGAPGTGSPVWDFPGTTLDTCGTKWQSTNNFGSLGNGVWGGYPTRTVMNAFEITQLEAAISNSAIRTDILNKMFIWLIGHDHPYDTIQTPVAGQIYTGNSIPIAWRAYAKGGATIDTTWVEYSNNEGASWNTLLKTTSLAASPYTWDITTRENGSKYQVRVRVQDKGLYPAMSGFDTVGNFTIQRVGNDFTGPVIVPGTIKFARNPVGNQAGNGFIVSCDASDSSTGLSGIGAVRCSVRVGASSYIGNLSPTDGSWGSIYEKAHGGISTDGWTPGIYTVYLRAQDNSTAKSVNNWGAWSTATLTVLSGISTPGAVSLSSFNHLVSTQGVTLKWATQSELDSDLWEIERSASAAGPYIKIAEKEAQGTTNQPTEYQYFDASVAPQKVYYYQLVEVSRSGDRTAYGPIEVRTLGPASFALGAPIPNPFSGQAEIRFQLPAASNVSLKIYNITGQLVNTLVNEVRPAGYYSSVWNGKNDKGQTMSNGVYFYSLEAGSYKSTKKITLIK
ncbi:MAG: S8 family serine peptidase [Candidatus Edwardsbacteria bacterium]|nr:S8 family serine peptidase [Candidatus Edwardsbacteria bacterium]